MPSKKVTMEDVAREAGVSKATVSYCISHTRPIREETRRRVRTAIEKLGYQAICDRRNVQKKFIAFLKDAFLELDPTTEYVTRKIQEKGYIACHFFLPADEEEKKENILRICSMPDLAGIVCFAKLDSVDIFKYCRGIPAVIPLRSDSMMAPVSLDFPLKMKLAKKHLHSLGHRKFFLLTEKQKIVTATNRIYLDAVEDENMEGESFQLFYDPSEAEIEELFAALDRSYANGCRAVIGMCTYFSLLVYRWIAQRGGTVPEDISILCLENTSIAHWISPPLTQICNPTGELAEYTVDALLAKINNEPEKSRKIRPFLQERGSTAPPKK